MKILIRTGILIAFTAFLPLDAKALVVTTTDPSVVALFQAGATIEDFDDLAALTITVVFVRPNCADGEPI